MTKYEKNILKMRQERCKNKTGIKNTQRYRYLVIKIEKISRFGLLKTLINTYFCREEKKFKKKERRFLNIICLKMTIVMICG